MKIGERVVVISGATGGLGQVVAQAFAAQGDRLALLSTNPDKLAALVARLDLPAERILAHAADLSDPAGVSQAMQAVIGKFGRADALIHLVGGWAGGLPSITASAEETQQMLQQHLWTTFHLVQAFIPTMQANHWGRLVVISSPIAVRPTATTLPYAVGKAAQETLLLTLAQELKGSGVTANIIHVRSIDVQHERLNAPSPKNASWTTPEEIAAAVLYLCSDQAGQVNGARLPLYGPG